MDSSNTWRHVKCSAEGRVVEINLSGLNLLCTLPDKLAQANELITLDLSSNRFNGPFPASWAGGTKFSKLRTLNLAQNELSGTLPPFNTPRSWRSLKTLDLSENEFYGGLPAAWLSRPKVFRKLNYLSLAGNQLGLGKSGEVLSKAQWCQSEADAELSPGSGWCPQGAYIAGTLGALETLKLGGNSFTGELPDKWPVMFSKLKLLSLELNSFSKLVDGKPVPSVLPASWSDPGQGFTSLTVLTLYPGNEYLCSVPDAEGSFQSINLRSSYQVTDDTLVSYSGENPAVCPTPENDNPPSSVTFTSTQKLQWQYPASHMPHLWGFRVALFAWDADGGEWVSASGGWASVALRTYTLGEDGFGATQLAAQGLACTAGGACTLTFADMQVEGLGAPDFSAPRAEVSKWRFDVTSINLDNTESAKVSATLANS